MASALKKCKSCGNDVDRGAKSCPHCGRKLKTGLFAKAIIVMIALVILGIALRPTAEERQASLNSKLATIAKATPANIQPTGELADMFNLMSDHTDLQRENKEKELVGKIVQWRLPVYEVSVGNEEEAEYRIKTTGESTHVGTFVNVHARNDEDKARITNLKTGDFVTVKGEITGTFMRNITIENALLIQ